MKVEVGKVYSCGKTMHRKIISINGDRIKYAKCYFTFKGFYVIGNGTHFLHEVGFPYFQSWAKSEVDLAQSAIKATEPHSEAEAEEG